MPLRELALLQQFLDLANRDEVLATAGVTVQDVARRITEWTAGLAEETVRVDPVDRRG